LVLSNETAVIEQYANDRSPGRENREAKPPPPEAETHLASIHSMEAANLPAF